MPFTNEIAGGQGTLVRNWLQSQNFVSGVSGWQITKSGNAEFNNGTFRGSITSGNPSGKHLILNNSVTGDAIDIYNTFNQLIFAITGDGLLESIDPVGGSILTMANAGTTYSNIGNPPAHGATISATASGTQTEVIINSGIPILGENPSQLAWLSGPSVSDGYLQAAQSGANTSTVVGRVMQTDTTTAGNGLFHMNTYNVTTDPTGTFTMNHGCNFTPTVGMWTIQALGDPIIGYFFSYSSTQAIARAFNGGSGANVASANFNITAFFVG